MTTTRDEKLPEGPLHGMRVAEFTHAVMGPSAGLILADLGAEVIRIEPPGGDATRELKGFGSGYFTYYNRNKKSVCIDLKSDAGRATALDLIASCDVMLENFAPGTIDRLGLGWDEVSRLNPGLVFASMKGFLSGPYEQRIAMDEVVQMMGGLAYMTGPRDRPLRAGTSVVDITGGMFAVIGVLAALQERQHTGRGRQVRAALFETTAFLMGQHMAWSAISGKPVPPMPERVSAWAVYRTFTSADDQPVFIGIISDRHWQRFCTAFERGDLAEDTDLRTNNDRIAARQRLLPDLEAMFRRIPAADIMARCEGAGIPFAPIGRPEDLFRDPHLQESGRLLPTLLPDGEQAPLPGLPLEGEGFTPVMRRQPAPAGADTRSVLQSLPGYDAGRLDHLEQGGHIHTRQEPL